MLLMAPVVGAAHAEVFQVDRVDDAPEADACDPAVAADCSLRGALVAANARAPEPSEVTLPAGTYVLGAATSCTYPLPTGGSGTEIREQLCVTAPVKITGAGAASTIIDGNLLDRVLFVSTGSEVELAHVTIQRGKIDDILTGDGGGGVRNEGTLRIVDSVVTDNLGGFQGGGVSNGGSLTVERSEIRENQAVYPSLGGLGLGGGIFQSASATLTLIDSTIRDNDAFRRGGGIYNFGGSAVIRGSAIYRNATAEEAAGGIGVAPSALGQNPTVTITNSTISENRAGAEGGGIYVASAKVFLQNVTVTDNVAGQRLAVAVGGGLFFHAGNNATARNTIIAGNSSASGVGPDCSGLAASSNFTLVSEGHNLIGNTKDCYVSGDTTGNLVDVDPRLAPLADNGGSTATQALLSDSPAIDAGDPDGCTDDAGSALSTDQRGSPRPKDGDDDGTARCDIGAFELEGGQAGGPTISRIRPGEGGNAAPLIAIVQGTGFAPGATVKLVRAGEADILASGATVDATGQAILGTLDLTAKTAGSWDLVVANPDGSSVTAPGAFTIASPRPPELWVDLAGLRAVRLGQPYRYVLLFGNRGNTDAFAVPLLFGVPETFLIRPRFEIAPPPAPPGTTVIQEWGIFYRELFAGESPVMRNLMLLLPVVPAGFSGALEVTVDMPPPKDLAVDEVPFRLELGDPLVDAQGPRLDKVAAFVTGARERADRLFSFPLPPSIDGELAARFVATLGTVVAEGTASLAESFGAEPQPYASLQLSYDLTVFGIFRAPRPAPAPVSVVSWLRAWTRWLGLPSAAVAQPNCCEGCFCDGGPKDVSPPKNCFAKKGPTAEDPKNCRPPKTSQECTALGFTVLLTDEGPICTNRPGCIFPNPIFGACIKVPVRIRGSFDPNDKTGPAGGGAAHAIRSDVTLPYTIRFENKAEATAPAAVVVITDQLDASQLDLATLTLGPLGFGDRTVTPPPGLTEFTTDVDLRPDLNLLVRVDAALDPGTAILTWRFTSLDPVTLEPPEDPLAGFLPPNAKPPEGDGYVSFTVAAKSAVTTGATIANQARIFFDANDPIDTPVWSNAIDDTPPASQMVSAVPVGGCSRNVVVTWSGSDQGTGVAGYEIAASENGGPFTPALASDATSGVFTGKWGAHYVFRSVATDLAGNVQDAPSAPGAEVTIPDCGPHDLAVIAVKMPAKIKHPKARPTVKKLAKVIIQNRGVTPILIEDAERLRELVTLTVEPLGACGPALVTLVEGKPQKPFPIVIASKKKHAVIFGVVFECVGDPATGKGHEDYRLQAQVHQTALGGEDAHPLDDVCPRTVAPPIVDPFPNGKIKEKGCGGKGPNGLGGPVLVDLTVGR